MVLTPDLGGLNTNVWLWRTVRPRFPSRLPRAEKIDR